MDAEKNCTESDYAWEWIDECDAVMRSRNPEYDGPMGIFTDYDGCDSDAKATGREV